MRIFSFFAALAVAAIMYLLIAERPMVVAFFGGDAEAQDVEETTAPTSTDADSAGLVKVVVHRSTAQEIDTAVVLRGQTTAAREVDVRAETSATVVSEPLRKGTNVITGQALCTLDQGTRGSALAQAQAQLNEARARVPEAGARLDQAQAQLQEAQINQNASAKLIQDGFASTTRLANADAAVATAQAGVESARAGLQAAQSGIQSAQASVALADKEIDRLVIRAPFSGLLESDTAELGSLLQPGALCGTIIQLDTIKLVAFVPETEVAQITVGAMAGARLIGGNGISSSSNNGDVQGRVTFLSRSADENTRTFRVEITVDNADLTIRDGQTAEILIASAGATAHLLPQSSLTLNDEGTLGVRTINDASIVEFHEISLMRDTTEGVWVTGLDDVANVIVVGQEYVIAGVKVAPTYQDLSQ